MRKRECKKFRLRLGPYLDGELSDRAGKRVEAHLEACPSCRGALERMRRTGALVRRGVESSARAEAADLETLLQRVRGEMAGSRVRPPRVRSWGARLLLPSALAALLVTALIFTIYKPPAPVIKGAYPNECVIESIESPADTVMLFQTHGSRITVIWISGEAEPGREEAGVWNRSVGV